MPRSLILEDYTLISDKPRNEKVIISSHGGTGSVGRTFRTPAELRFFTHSGVTTKKQIRDIPAMGDKEFEVETANTNGVQDHVLNWYEHDPVGSFEQSIRDGFDVVTIQRNKDVWLSRLVNQLSKHYKVFYCLFCRVPTVRERIQVLPGTFRDERKSKR